MTPEPCNDAESSGAFHERHSDMQRHTWRDIAQNELAPATCVHQGSALNLFAVDVYDEDEWVSFAVDFDNGYLYREVAVRSVSSDPFNKPDTVLSTEALAELREAIDRYRVLDWPFREPGESNFSYEDYSDPNAFKLAAVFSDDTGSYASQTTGSDPDMVGFLHFAQSFLAGYVD